MYFRSRDLVLLDDRGRKAKEDGWAGRDTDKQVKTFHWERVEGIKS